MKRYCDSLCPMFQRGMDVLGKPWNAFILAALAGDPLRFSALLERLPTIGDRMLSARLRELEARGLVVRNVHPGPPVRVEYQLTTPGKSFRGVAEAISAWGARLTPFEGETPARRTRRRATR